LKLGGVNNFIEEGTSVTRDVTTKEFEQNSEGRTQRTIRMISVFPDTYIYGKGYGKVIAG